MLMDLLKHEYKYILEVCSHEVPLIKKKDQVDKQTSGRVWLQMFTMSFAGVMRSTTSLPILCCSTWTCNIS